MAGGRSKSRAAAGGGNEGKDMRRKPSVLSRLRGKKSSKKEKSGCKEHGDADEATSGAYFPPEMPNFEALPLSDKEVDGILTSIDKGATVDEITDAVSKEAEEDWETEPQNDCEMGGGTAEADVAATGAPESADPRMYWGYLDTVDAAARQGQLPLLDVSPFAYVDVLAAAAAAAASTTATIPAGNTTAGSAAVSSSTTAIGNAVLV